jgi:hypothetical protein
LINQTEKTMNTQEVEIKIVDAILDALLGAGYAVGVNDEVLHHCRVYQTDEGYGASFNEWEFDGLTLINRWAEECRDCDGRIDRHGVSYCRADEVRAGYVDPEEPSVVYPKWWEGKGGQRDYSAEAMGY